ncbi:MAG: hypothetical protein J6X61_00365 [Clostridia bacterium]|nr:hypothetical protein [Clostridia bacterium]
MKRVCTALLALALLLTACTGAPTGDASAQPASSTGTGASSVDGSREEGSSAAAPSKSASSAALSSDAAASASSSGESASSRAVTSSAAPVKMTDVDALFAASGKSMTADVSSCFPKDAEGYLINGGTATKPYLVDADTLFRLTEKPVSGSGTVKWVGFSQSINNAVNPDPFTGVVPVSKLHDPLYMSVCLPSEAPTYMTKRINASNLYPVSVTTSGAHVQTHLIGAVYRNEDNKPKDTDVITVCISDFRLLYHSAKTGWVAAEKNAVPSSRGNVNALYCLPWQLGWGYALPEADVTLLPGDHAEIRLTGAQLSAAALIDADGKVTCKDGVKRENGKLPIRRSGSVVYNGTLEEACLHFWGNNKMFSTQGLSADTVDGMVSAYRIWIKEPEMVGKVVAAIGIDQLDKQGNIDQSYSGRNYLITTEPRWVIGHNVGPKAYDTVMDSEAVQRLIDMK